MFSLHHQLLADCRKVGRFPLSLLLLMKDAQYPWFILVPQREDVSEIFQLNALDRRQLLDESCHLAEVLKDVFAADKLNIAALGNMVPQLHVHHVVRYRSDVAWPAPVWGRLPVAECDEQLIAQRIDRLRGVLGLGFVFSGERT
ncbi:HIT domain-containing protein [Halopseudomonas yangmingensis]|uniref:Diadenosine tetraphosphate (Ap4A) hydrolase n=1 Tax=Halopseudomonas yangmingensis TaxID=1720063 RepID=A0A1I4NGT0_9GAMM|nr:HIT domain-containing protein [Halopseudomonas yangmingensis]SFM14507.1 Diadenosine tetraphosphate (Ap4A) hydrolase [Halopseudomonas yangmingensis]